MPPHIICMYRTHGFSLPPTCSNQVRHYLVADIEHVKLIKVPNSAFPGFIFTTVEQFPVN